MERRSPYHVKLSGETNRKVKRNMVKRWQNRLIKQRPGDILDSHVPPRAESIRGGPRPRGRGPPRMDSARGGTWLSRMSPGRCLMRRFCQRLTMLRFTLRFVSPLSLTW